MAIKSFLQTVFTISLALQHVQAKPVKSATKLYAGPLGIPTLSAAPLARSLTSIPSASTTAPATLANDTVPNAGPSSGNRKIQYGGVNIAGFDFGCTIDGTCKQGGAVTSMASGAGALQMKHFVNKGLNTFRLPVGWQYLTGYDGAASQLSETNWAVYDQLVQSCLSSGAALCIIDVHNYARWNGQIIGQGGPNNEMFAQFWGQLAAKYAKENRVAFDIMNEPHDINMAAWKDTMQAVVTSIRTAGANNMIILSGTSFASAGAFTNAGNGDALLSIKNPNGGNDNIVFSVHQYLDNDFSGTSTECSQGSTASGNFQRLAQFLRLNGHRKAMVLEIGGGNTQSCVSQLCQVLDTINANSDVFIGVTTWAAGAFGPQYELNEVPTGTGAALQDTLLVQSCVIPKLGA